MLWMQLKDLHQIPCLQFLGSKNEALAQASNSLDTSEGGMLDEV